MLRSGYATPAGTRHYAGRFAGVAHAGHWRQADGLTLSSLGIGTYLGDADDATDDRYRHAIRRAVERGANVIDTASNYRFQRSERVIRQALADLEAIGFPREELVVATKGGYLPFDDAPPADFRRYVQEQILTPGLAEPGEIVQGHCLAPRFLANQIEQSRQNLGLATLDAYYLHNAETQLGSIDQATFEARLRAAFAVLETAVADGRIRRYGMATWNGFRVEPGASGYHALGRMVALAREVGGPGHHFGIIQLPFNLVMAEAYRLPNQDGQTTLQAAQELGLIVMSSASILQAQLSRDLPLLVERGLPEQHRDAQRALQITRSAPGLTTALVGMSRMAHVEENLQLVAQSPMPADRFARLMTLAHQD